jgi:hypothetical protein
MDAAAKGGEREHFFREPAFRIVHVRCFRTSRSSRSSAAARSLATSGWLRACGEKNVAEYRMTPPRAQTIRRSRPVEIVALPDTGNLPLPRNEALSRALPALRGRMGAAREAHRSNALTWPREPISSAHRRCRTAKFQHDTSIGRQRASTPLPSP